MRIVADPARCQGHARCADICPAVFTNDDRLGKVVVRLREIPPQLEDDAVLAVNNCPEGALAVQEK